MGCKAGAAGDDDPAIALEGVDGVFRLPNLGQYTPPANLVGDEVGVLPSEVYDGDAIVCHCYREALGGIGGPSRLRPSGTQITKTGLGWEGTGSPVVGVGLGREAHSL